MLCVIRPDGNEDLKLIDFGMARVLEKGKKVTVACGTPEFVGKYLENRIREGEREGDRECVCPSVR